MMDDHMGDVVKFVRARLAEAEESPRRLLELTEKPTPVAIHVAFLADAFLKSEQPSGLIVIQNPERELRDIKAKRILLRRYEAAVNGHRNSRRPEVEMARMEGRAAGLKTAVLLAAEVYADHPDY